MVGRIVRLWVVLVSLEWMKKSERKEQVERDNGTTAAPGARPSSATACGCLLLVTCCALGLLGSGCEGGRLLSVVEGETMRSMHR